MNDYKYNIDDTVETEFNSSLNRRVVTVHKITGRDRAPSDSGNVYFTDPPIGSGYGTDENWFRPVSAYTGLG